MYVTLSQEQLYYRIILIGVAQIFGGSSALSIESIHRTQGNFMRFARALLIQPLLRVLLLAVGRFDGYLCTMTKILSFRSS